MGSLDRISKIVIKSASSKMSVSSDLIRRELHLYSDSSDKAIGYVAYMRSETIHGDVHVSFVTSSSKVAPRCASSIPRMELCAAFEAARASSAIIRELEEKPDAVFMYSDSKIVLGYISNTEKRFSKYVER